MMMTRGWKRVRRSPSTSLLQRSVFTDFHVHSEVADALKSDKPVVALESTIISHGMPYPRNLEVATKLEEIVRDNGAVPATIAIIDGFPKVGLTSSELRMLAEPPSELKNPVVKASRRDIAYACAHRLNAATTVSGTMMIASMAGIRVFATGGIGGVHRGAEDTFDISADLQELARTPVTVVSSGVKSILDIGKTLEVLESMGVPVCGYQTPTFPAFFTNDSGFKAPIEVENALAVARMMACQDDLQLGQGMVVAVPNPNPSGDIEEAIQVALRDATTDGIVGAKITPYVLSKVTDMTAGRSLEANVALVENNAKIGAMIACAYTPLAKQRKQEQARREAVEGKNADEKSKGGEGTDIPQPSDIKDPSNLLQYLKSKAGNSGKEQVGNLNEKESSLSEEELNELWNSVNALKESEPQSDSIVHPSINEELSQQKGNENDKQSQVEVIIFGAAVIDRIMTPLDTTQPLTIHSSNPGRIRSSYGGVGRNIAEATARLGVVSPLMVSAVGLDHEGDGLLKHSGKLGIDISAISRPQSKDRERYGTATYAAIHDHRGDLAVAIADMDIFHHVITPTVVGHLNGQIKQAKLIVADGNLSPQTIKALANVCSTSNKPLLFEPTSDHKCLLPVEANALHQVDVITPNLSELRTIMTECCVYRDMSVAKKSLIVGALAEGASNPDQPNYLVNIRVLAAGLLHLMMNAPDHVRPVNTVNDDRAVKGKHVIVTLGRDGLLWVSSNGEAMGWDIRNRIKSKEVVELDDNTFSRHIPVSNELSPVDIVNTCGAGDTFCAGLIHSIINSPGHDMLSGIRLGMKYAEKALRSADAVPSDVNLQELLDELKYSRQ